MRDVGVLLCKGSPSENGVTCTAIVVPRSLYHDYFLRVYKPRAESDAIGNGEEIQDSQGNDEESPL